MFLSISDLISIKKNEFVSLASILLKNERETWRKRRSESMPQTGLKDKLDGAISGADDLVIRTETCWRCG